MSSEGVALEPLDPKVVWYWRLAAVPRFLLFIGMLAAVVLVRDSSDMALAAVGGFGVVFGLSMLWTIAIAGVRYRRFGFRFDQGMLYVERGVFIHRSKTIPVDRMQHLDVERGPIERWFGLARLVVFTAGGRGATFQLPGLSSARADSLRDQILAQR